jgi:class 3 adenylate cyclase
MADLHKMDRTWLCSVVFMDIVNYSSQSVELQMKWKQRFNGYLSETIHEVPESERVILDTGDGAAVCFLGAPEAAMFAALQLCQAFVVDEREHRPGLCVRIGINLGPVKLIKDVNGALNAIGDGINAGQRIMSFASVNQILVSQSFFEVVSRLSDDYKAMFQWKGVEADKHVREHTVYSLTPPGSEKRDYSTANVEAQSIPATPLPAAGAPGSSGNHIKPKRWIWLAGGGVALMILGAAGAWHFDGSINQAATNSNATPVVQKSIPSPPAVPVASLNEPVSQPPGVSHPDRFTPDARPVPVVNAPLTKTPVSPLPSKPESSSVSPAPPDPVKLLREGKSQFANNNPERARESFRKAADAGNPQAMVLMGTFYAQGLGGPRSDSDAVSMFRRAAELGDARGMYNLGLMYEAGRGVPAGAVDQASDWYAKAANRGDGDAAYRLGLMYEQGRGVPRNLTEARRLYALARTPEATTRLASLPSQ